jgi:hypothetical protein
LDLPPLNIELPIEELRILRNSLRGIIPDLVLYFREIKLLRGPVFFHAGWRRDRGFGIRKFPHDPFIVDHNISAFLLHNGG